MTEEVFPKLIERFGNRLTIWSAACSTGDEPYSLVMALSKYVPLSQIKVIATDLSDEIIEKADAYCIASASVQEIDELNILNATMLAMKRAVEGLGIKPDLALIDGNRLPELECESRYVIHGDAVSASIAAASILAKVTRDRYMCRLDEEYPQYCFSKHKGYGTKLHYEKIAEFGISDVHRKTFLKKLYE